METVSTASWARIPPPPSLTPAQAEVWRDVVATKPADWFEPGSAPVLEAYCQTFDNYRRTARMIEQCPANDFDGYRKLAELSVKQSNMLANLATKMRLTQQSSYTHRSADTAKRRGGLEIKKPWETQAR